MPDTPDIIAAIEARGTATANDIGQRVTRVEVKIEGLERDTSVIRSTLHSVNSELQKTAIYEERCAQSLKQIAEQTKGLPDLVTKTLAFEELTPKIRTLIDERIERRGAWKMWGVVAGLIGLFAGFSSAVVALVIHYIEH